MIDYDELVSFRSDVPPMSDAAFERGLSRIEAAPASKKPHRTRQFLIAAAVAAAAFTGGVVALGSHHPANASAAEVLDDAAGKVLLEPALHPERGQFVYQRVESLGNTMPTTIEYWIPADSTERETICVTDDGCTVLPYEPKGARDQGIPYDVLSSLPTAGPAMLDYLRHSPIAAYLKSTGQSENLAIWNAALQLGDLFPPAQEAALFQALTRLHDVRVEGQVTTSDGRSGVAIGITTPKADKGQPTVDNQLVFAADTHEYIGERNVQTFSKQGDQSEVVSFNSSRAAAVVVDRAQQRP